MESREYDDYEEATIFESVHTSTGTGYRPTNGMHLFCAVTGFGKTLAMEDTAFEYWRCGYTVINLTDVKNNFENCYAMLPETIIPPFHLYKIRNVEKKVPQSIPSKIYHPFTFNIPQRRNLPDINFYTIPLKSLRREHFSFLSETHTSSETVKLMLNATGKMGDDDGLYKFISLVNEAIEDKTSMYKGKKVKKINKEFFTPTTTSGTMKDVQQIQSLFIPFKRDFFLTEQDCKLNIDFRDIINDNQHYHNLTYKWVEDDKMKYFAIISFLLGINEVLDYAKKPICIVIDEIRYLVPDKAQGYKQFLAEIIKNLLSTLRNKGRGVAVISGSQVYYDIEETVRSSFSETILGRITSQDIERLAKVMGWNQSVRQLMSSMKRNHFKRVGDENVSEWTWLFPPHPHKETNMNFFDLYHEFYSIDEKKYSDLAKEMKQNLKKEQEEAKKSAEYKDKRQKEMIKQQVEEKEKKSKAVLELEKVKEEQKMEKNKNKEELMKQCYEIFTEPTNPEPPTYSAIGRQLGISVPTVKKYIETYAEKKKDLDSRPDPEKM